jgi:hypothetical protein
MPRISSISTSTQSHCERFGATRRLVVFCQPCSNTKGVEPSGNGPQPIEILKMALK